MLSKVFAPWELAKAIPASPPTTRGPISRAMTTKSPGVRHLCIGHCRRLAYPAPHLHWPAPGWSGAKNLMYLWWAASPFYGAMTRRAGKAMSAFSRGCRVTAFFCLVATSKEQCAYTLILLPACWHTAGQHAAMGHSPCLEQTIHIKLVLSNPRCLRTKHHPGNRCSGSGSGSGSS